MATTYGVYIHIPFCKSKCDYCDFYSLAGREEEMDHYQKALIAQLRSFAPRLKGRVADTIYFGGGTPSYYGEKRLRELLVLIQRVFTVSRPGGDHRGVQPRQRGLALHRPPASGGGEPHLRGRRPPTPNSCAVCTASTPPGKWSRPWRTFGGRRSRTSA